MQRLRVACFQNIQSTSKTNEKSTSKRILSKHNRGRGPKRNHEKKRNHGQNVQIGRQRFNSSSLKYNVAKTM